MNKCWVAEILSVLVRAIKQLLCSSSLSLLLFFKSKLINAYQHHLSLLSSLPVHLFFFSDLWPFSLLLLLPPVRDDFFGKAHLAYARGHILLVMSSPLPPGLQLSHPSGSFSVSAFLCGFIFTFCATFASHIPQYFPIKSVPIYRTLK